MTPLLTLPEAAGHPRLDPITVSIQEAARITGLSHVSIYRLMKEGRVRYTKFGRRTLVSYASLREFLGVDDLAHKMLPVRRRA